MLFPYPPVHRIHWQCLQSISDAGLWLWLGHWYQPVWCIFGRPAGDRFHCSILCHCCSCHWPGVGTDKELKLFSHGFIRQSTNHLQLVRTKEILYLYFNSLNLNNIKLQMQVIKASNYWEAKITSIYQDQISADTKVEQTLALNSARKSKCFLRSVARIASITKKRKRLNSTWSRFDKKLYSGRDKKRFQADAAWWFSKTDLSL